MTNHLHKSDTSVLPLTEVKGTAALLLVKQNTGYSIIHVFYSWHSFKYSYHEISKTTTKK